MTPKGDFLTTLKTHPYWPFFVKEIERARPIVPSHDPNNDNTELWKSISAQQTGFDLCLALFQLNKE